MKTNCWMVVLVLMTIGCATTRYGNIPASQLTDDQLVEELYSVYSQIGIVRERISFLMAIRPTPSYVLRGLTTSTAIGSAYISGNNIHGSAYGMSQSTYWLEDQTAFARGINTLVTITQQINLEMLESRRVTLEAEAWRRITDKEYNNNRIVNNFFAKNPDLKEELLLVGCIAPWVQSLNPNMDLENLLPRVAGAVREVVKRRSAITNYSGPWFGLFSETITMADGQHVEWTDYLLLHLVEKDGKVNGQGRLYTGQSFELAGELKNEKMVGKVVDKAQAWDADFSLDCSLTRLSGQFSGSGQQQTFTGVVILIR